MTNEAWLTVGPVAAHLNIASVSVYHWIEAGKTPCHQVGHQWRFSASEIGEWLLSGNASDLEKKRSKTRKRNKILQIKEASI